MEPDFWKKKWEAGDIGFHQAQVEPFLIKYFSDLTPGIVFVPLCGKSKDLIWLVQNGWTVVGVEASSIACQAFFEENKISYQKEKKDNFTVYQGVTQITIWCGDYFKLPKEAVLGVTAIYDRAALIALPREVRLKYVDQNKILFPRARFQTMQILLLAIEYPQEHAQGPPFSVDTKEIQQLYGDLFSIRELEKEEDKILPERSDKFHGVQIFETVYWLSRESS